MSIVNVIIYIIYLIVFIASNLTLWVIFRNEDQVHDNVQHFRVKSMTIGILLLVSLLLVLGMVLILPQPEFDLRINFISNFVCIAFFALFTVKEHEFTFPFILNISLWRGCLPPNAVAPLAPSVLPMEELNPRALQNTSEACRVIDLEDDGGIYVG